MKISCQLSVNREGKKENLLIEISKIDSFLRIGMARAFGNRVFYSKVNFKNKTL